MEWDPSITMSVRPPSLADADPERQESAWAAVEREAPDAARAAVAAVVSAADPAVRARVARWLAERAGADALPLVGPLVRDPDPSVRRVALRAIAPLGDAALPHLAAGLDDADAALRRIAVESIARLRAPEAVEPLARAAQDPDPAVRRIAARALARSDAPRARDACLWGLFDSDLATRGLAFGGFAKIAPGDRAGLLLAACGEISSRGLLPGPEDVGAVARELPTDELARFVEVSLAGEGAVVASRVWPIVRDELARRGDVAGVALLRRGVEEGASEVRAGCLRALRLADSPEAQKALCSLARHDEVALRLGVIAEIAARPFPEGTLAMVARLADADPSVRLAALRALRSKPPEGWIDRLLEVASDASVDVRKEAVEELGRSADARARAALVTACADAEVEVRRAALRRLPLDDDLLPTCLAALEWPFPERDQDWGGPVRERIVRRLGERMVQDALPVLARIANEDRVLLRRAAVESILKIGGPEALRAVYSTPDAEGEASPQQEERPAMSAEEAQAILAKLANLDDPDVVLEPRVRDALAAFRDTPDKSVLRKVALGLGRAGDPRGLLPLVRSLEECRGSMVFEAKKLIARYPEHRSIGFLVPALKSRWTSIRRFAAERMREATDPRALEPLLAAIEDEDSEVQCAVVSALANYATDPRVTPRLLGCVTLGDISVRQAAIEALGDAKVQEAVPSIIAALQNPFLRDRAEAALRKIGDRKGVLAVKRVRRRESLFPSGRKREEERKRRLKPKGKPKP